MKIGIIVTASHNSGGIFQYTLSVIKALYGMPTNCTFTIFVPPGRNLDLSSFNKSGWSVDTLDASIFTSSEEIQQQISSGTVELTDSGFNTRARDYFNFRNIGLLIFPAPWNMSFECGMPYVMAIHDLQHRLQPEFPEVSANGEWRGREYLFRNGAKFAEMILVDSDIGKEDVLNCYGDVIAADKIAVLPFSPALQPDTSITSSEEAVKILASYRIPETYFFYPAQFWFHKNHARIVEALAILRQQHNISPHLVLVGSHEGPPHERRLDVINNVIDLSVQHAVAEQIHYLGYVPDAHMPVLYNHAIALVMPTFFGPTNIPILEAWAFGCPVITSNIRGVREQAGDSALLVDPTDSVSIADGMFRIWSDSSLRSDLQAKGFQRLKNFDFSNFSRTLQSSMDGLLKDSAPAARSAVEPDKNTVVIDGVIFQQQHGREIDPCRLWRALLSELAATPLGDRIVMLDREGNAPEIPGLRRRRIPSFTPGNACGEAAALELICREEGARLFVSTSSYTVSTPSLMLLYDMLPERLNTVGPEAPDPECHDRYHTIANSSSFAAASQSTANDLTLFYPQAAQRPMTVIPFAVADEFRIHSREEIADFKAACGIDRPYFLLAGLRDLHKNHALFFQAFARLPDRERYAIVMAGGGNMLEPELRVLAGEAAGYAGLFSDQDLSLAYSGAIALVYPSLYEGCALPILEAMRSGCPVIACQNSSIPEAAGSAALYVGEQDVEGMSRALLEVQNYDVRAYLVKRGAERARLFSWQKSSELLAEAIRHGSGRISTRDARPSPLQDNNTGFLLSSEPCETEDNIAPQESPPLVSAIVSTYNSERYIRGCIEDLERQTIADRLEIIVIDSGSSEQEGEIVREMQEVFGNIRYVRTDERETVYAAWNRGVKLARGRYLTNANCDDRHRADAFERMVAVFEDDPDVDLVYADALITVTPNETFEQCTRTGAFTWLEPDRNALLYRGCFVGPQPLWRKTLHDVYGLFDPSYITSGDYEFWLRVSQTASFYHIAEPLGLYLSSPTSIEHAYEECKGRENSRLLFRYRGAAINGNLLEFLPFSRLRTILTSGTWDTSHEEKASLVDDIDRLAYKSVGNTDPVEQIYIRSRERMLAATPCSHSELDRFITLAKRLILGNIDWFTAGINGVRDEAMLQGLFIRKTIQRARCHAMRGEVDAAIEILLQQGIKVAANDPAPYLALMELLIAAGRFSDALEVIGQLPEGTDRATVLYLRAVCYEKRGEYDAAQQCAAEAFALAPDDARVLTVMGVLAFHRSEKEAAARLFEAAMQADPGFGEPCANLGVMKWSAGELEAGLNLLERAAVLSPLDNDIRILYYGAAGELGAYDQAEQRFAEDVVLYPDCRGVALFLIDVLEKQKKDAEAMERLEAALVRFGCDDDLLDAALNVRSRVPLFTKIRENGDSSVSLCMIVKDEARNLAACLASIKPVAHEMIVVDTGSSDRTVDIATAFGARVCRFAWNGNFSDARNYAIAQAHGTWILVVDADEALSKRDYAAVENIISSSRGKTAWSVLTRNYTTKVNALGWTANDGAYPAEEAADGWHPSWKARLFPNQPDIRFSGEVHEMVENSLLTAGYTISKASFVVHHYGGLEECAEEAVEKKRRYFEIGMKKLEKNPDGVGALSELAVQAGELGDFDEALRLWNRLLKFAPDNIEALFNKGYALIGLQRYQEALVSSEKVLNLVSTHKEAAFNYGTCELYVGEPVRAVHKLEPLLQQNPEYPPLLAVLTLLYLLSGRRKKAAITYSTLKAMNYSISDYARSRGDVLIRLGKKDVVRMLLDECKSIGMDV